MGYSREQGYIPVSVQTIMLSIMTNINAQFQTSYTIESFEGTNFYKNFYALAQKVQEGEIKTAEIFLKLQQYIVLMNERISRPVVTPPGLIEKFAAEGYIASVKPMIEVDAGKINIAVDVDETDPNYAETKLIVATIIKDSTILGGVTMGDQVETIVLSNGQAFDYKFHLPNRIPIKLRLTITLSENNQTLVGDPDETKVKLLGNILSRYRLGKNFEPQRYFGIQDAPWASQVLLEWSDDDGVTWTNVVFDADFSDLFSFGLEDIELVEE